METQIEAPFLDDADHAHLWSIAMHVAKLPPLLTLTPEKSGLPVSLWLAMFEGSVKSTKGTGSNGAFHSLLSSEDLVGDCRQE